MENKNLAKGGAFYLDTIPRASLNLGPDEKEGDAWTIALCPLPRTIRNNGALDKLL